MKKYSQKICSVILVLMMIVTMMPTMSFAVEGGNQNVAALSFENVDADGQNIISMTEEKTFEASFELEENMSVEEAKDYADGLTWYLKRDKGMQDEEIFPHQYLGGQLDEWKVVSGSEVGKDLFTVDADAKEITKADSTTGVAISAKIFNKLFFGSTAISGRDGGNKMLDYTGDFELYCTDEEGKKVASTTVRVNPYDSYETFTELVKSINEAADYINTNKSDKMYAEVLSMGKSTMGFDTPYIIIADSKKTLDEYQELNELAVTNPEEVIEKIKSGEISDYKVPVMYSNVHPGELPGVDAPMKFIWDLATKDVIEFDTLTGFTAEGQAQLESELSEKKIHWSELLKDEDGAWPTGLGFITTDENKVESKYGTSYVSGKVDLKKYYNVETVEMNVSELLQDVFFIVVPTENPDGRTRNNRQNINGLDLNRDALFQTQQETKNITKVIADWNPVTFVELHGFADNYQVEPCSPPHEPNVEYDLLAEHMLGGGEAFGIVSVANSDVYNSYVLPIRDYLVEDAEGNPYWEEPWDDMSTNYTPQYSLLHGTMAYTIESPAANEETAHSLEYGLIGHGKYIADNKEEIYLNQLEGWLRGINNEDNEETSKWYVDIYDTPGAEAEAFRPKYEGNDNFFPEYYVIPVDSESQKNLKAAKDMQEFLFHNNVIVKTLTQDTTVNGKLYKKGSIVVDMHQAKRNVANGALYDGVLITGWPTLYSEPITAFNYTRGFDCDAIDIEGAFDGKLEVCTGVSDIQGVFTGVTNYEVVIENDGIEAVKAINSMLDNGKTVGMVTEGQYNGNFIVYYNDYNDIKDDFIIKAIGVKSIDEAKVITKPTIYVAGLGAYDLGYGAINTSNVTNASRNFDVLAFEQQMGFTVTTELDEADVIVGNRDLKANELEYVKNGVPYIAYGATPLKGAVKTLLADKGFKATVNGSFDALFTVTYESDSIITSVYDADKDYIMYGFGGSFINAVPEGATVLIKNTSDTPYEGFFIQDKLDEFLGEDGNIQAFEYVGDGLDMTVFANSLTQKLNQQDDYRYATNAAYSKMFDGEFKLLEVQSSSHSSSSSSNSTTNLEAPTEQTPDTEANETKDFTDVKSDAWYKQAVDYAVEKGILKGVTETQFAPQNEVTRAMFVTILYRIAGEPEADKQSFTDVAAGKYYEKAVAWASENGIVNGITETQFAPDMSITREQMATILYRYCIYKAFETAKATELDKFADKEDVSSWATDAMGWTNANGLINGKTEDTLAPKDMTTRAEISIIIMRFMENIMK